MNHRKRLTQLCVSAVCLCLLPSFALAQRGLKIRVPNSAGKNILEKLPGAAVPAAVAGTIEKKVLEQATAQQFSHAQQPLLPTQVQYRLKALDISANYTKMMLFSTVEDVVTQTNKEIVTGDSWGYRTRFEANLKEALEEMPGLPATYEEKIAFDVWRLMKYDLLSAEVRSFVDKMKRLPKFDAVELLGASGGLVDELELAEDLLRALRVKPYQDFTVAQLYDFVQPLGYDAWAERYESALSNIRQREEERALSVLQKVETEKESLWKKQRDEIAKRAAALKEKEALEEELAFQRISTLKTQTPFKDAGTDSDIKKPTEAFIASSASAPQQEVLTKGTRFAGRTPSGETVGEVRPPAPLSQTERRTSVSSSSGGIELTASAVSEPVAIKPTKNTNASAPIQPAVAPVKKRKTATPRAAVKPKKQVAAAPAAPKWNHENGGALLAELKSWIEMENIYPRSMSLAERESYGYAVPPRRVYEAELRMRLSSFIVNRESPAEIKAQVLKYLKEYSPSVKRSLK